MGDLSRVDYWRERLFACNTVSEVKAVLSEARRSSDSSFVIGQVEEMAEALIQLMYEC